MKTSPEAGPSSSIVDTENLPPSPVTGDELAASMNDMLEKMGPEKTAAVVGVGGVALGEVVKLSPAIVSETDQIEAFANDSAHHRTIAESTVPRRASADEISVINENLKNFSVSDAEHSDIESTDVNTDTTEADKPISGRRVLDTKKPVAESSEDQALIDDLTTGKISSLGTKLSGMKDLRSARKEIISKQTEAMEQVIDTARGEKWNARGRRVANWKQNNFVKRVGQRSNKRAEYRDMAFDAIENADASNPRKALMRLQARKNAWKVARENVRKTTTESFTLARDDVIKSKLELKRQKDRASSLRFSPLRRRTTMGGAGSAGILETWGDSGRDLTISETARRKNLEARMAALKERKKARETALKEREEAQKLIVRR